MSISYELRHAPGTFVEGIDKRDVNMRRTDVLPSLGDFISGPDNLKDLHCKARQWPLSLPLPPSPLVH